MNRIPTAYDSDWSIIEYAKRVFPSLYPITYVRLRMIRSTDADLAEINFMKSPTQVIRQDSVLKELMKKCQEEK